MRRSPVRNRGTYTVAAAAVVVCCCFAPCLAAEKPSPSPPVLAATAEKPSEAGKRWAMIASGLPGDAEHVESFAAVVQDLCDALTVRLRFPADQVLVWSGAAAKNCRPMGPATRESLAAGAAELQKKLQPADTLWVFVLGHAHFDGRRGWFNIPGRDLEWRQFAALFDKIGAVRQVFFITTPVSGFALPHLSRKGRVVITATEAEREVNETTFARVLATVLKTPLPLEEIDGDQDGRVSLLDIYFTTSWGVLKVYALKKHIPTEHAQIDDNGDGRGSEIQLDYLDKELGGRANAGQKPPPIRPGRDGALAASMVLEFAEDRPPESNR